ncbi:Crp/Fnr family transcriptional regulator [Paraflavitalea pollutisoli]|uniref:Crp/Fnr family transcriptional regulator n=1 Tax=Paraflavitalea pollutisoli TaxID=3034143 RepID=UPI0023ED0B1B|nr:Crp/Fnr family transcriptional regulator [Paraflavitalea sp. H1-2-19X]
MEQELALLRKQIFALHPLSDEEWQAFSAIWQPVQYKRKTILTTAGETERHLYFVTEGVQRAFYLDDKHPEITVVFTYAPSFSGVADSFLTQQPSRFFLETLTTSKMLRTTHQQVQALMDKYHNIERWIRLSTSWVMMGLLERQIELLSYSAEEKFRILLKRSPHVLQLIPHKYLASYLGIDASTFSKLMSTVRI